MERWCSSGLIPDGKATGWPRLGAVSCGYRCQSGQLAAAYSLSSLHVLFERIETSATVKMPHPLTLTANSKLFAEFVDMLFDEFLQVLFPEFVRNSLERFCERRVPPND